MFGLGKTPVHDPMDESTPYSGKHEEEVGRVEVVEEDLRYGGTQRKLKSRHIQLIALGKTPWFSTRFITLCGAELLSGSI